MTALGLVLALLLLAPVPAQAVPIRFIGVVQVTTPAPPLSPCDGWVWTLTPIMAPPCPGLLARIQLSHGDPANLWFTLVHDPGLPSQRMVYQSIQPVTGSTPGGPQDAWAAFDLWMLPDGLTSMVFALTTEMHIYDFTLIRPRGLESEPPAAATPEPATLVLLGTALAGAGYVARKRGRR